MPLIYEAPASLSKNGKVMKKFSQLIFVGTSRLHEKIATF